VARERLVYRPRETCRLPPCDCSSSTPGRFRRWFSEFGQRREQLELEIASRLSEANSFEEQAAFEALLYGSKGSDGPNLKNATDAIEEIYVACLPWLREQRPGLTSRDGEGAKTAPEPTKTLVEPMADLMDQSHLQKADENQLPIDHLIKDEEKDLGSRVNYHSDSLEQLIGAIKEFQALASARQKV
jgi:hypothetical protein